MEDLQRTYRFRDIIKKIFAQRSKLLLKPIVNSSIYLGDYRPILIPIQLWACFASCTGPQQEICSEIKPCIRALFIRIHCQSVPPMSECLCKYISRCCPWIEKMIGSSERLMIVCAILVLWAVSCIPSHFFKWRGNSQAFTSIQISRITTTSLAEVRDWPQRSQLPRGELPRENLPSCSNG